MSSVHRVDPLDAPRLEEVVDVHCDAFADYPTMRWVLGDGDDFDRRLRRLVRLFLETTRLCGGHFLGVTVEGQLVAAADVVDPAAVEPSELDELRAATWSRLGRPAHDRYRDYALATAAFKPRRPHCYLSMLGVRRSAAGTGCGRALLDAVHSHSSAHPQSTGVALETEDPVNVDLYRHFGYRIVGHRRLRGGLESWGFFRPDD